MAIDFCLITHLYKYGEHKTSLDINMYMYSFPNLPVEIYNY